jgi:hypothetical protein
VGEVYDVIDTNGQLIPRVGVVLGIRFSRLVTPEWAIGLATQNFGMGVNVAYGPVHCQNPKTGSQGLPRDLAAEYIVQHAIDADVPYIFFVDDDVELPYGACRHLMQTLASSDDDVMCAGGIYVTKQSSPEPIVFSDISLGVNWRWKKDTVFPCELIGLGCSLWKTEVFRRIEKPWFRDVDTSTLSCTDDAFFFAKMKLAGYKALADAYVLPVHWDYETGKGYKLPDDSYPMLPSGKEEIFKNIPPGWMSIPELTWLSDQAAKHRRIVELGSYLGRSTVVMARSTPGEVWAIDDFKGVRDTQFFNTDVPILSDTFSQFVANVQSLPVKSIRADHADYTAIPLEWLRGQAAEKPDMVFIDGSHEYPDVKRDILAWQSRLAPGGLLCGHDADWPGVRQAIDELLPGWQTAAGVIWSYQL